MNKSRILFIIGLVAAAAIARLLPHPVNFAPIAALALFGGAYLPDRRLAFVVPLAAMLLTDLVLGLHATMAFVYLGFVITVAIGTLIATRLRVVNITLAALSASVIFFFLSNFGVWLVSDLYPRDPAGLLACFSAAIPFFQNSLAGDLFYTAVLFGGMALADRHLSGAAAA